MLDQFIRERSGFGHFLGINLITRDNIQIGNIKST